jgi:hypothetical protein
LAGFEVTTHGRFWGERRGFDQFGYGCARFRQRFLHRGRIAQIRFLQGHGHHGTRAA